MCRPRGFACAVIVLSLAAPAALAQPAADAPADGAGSGSGSAEPAPTTGELSGTVESPELDAPLAGATIKIVGTAVGTTSDDTGHFKLDVAPGEVKIRVESAGFKPEERLVSI